MDMCEIQRRALQLMAEKGIDAVCLDLPGASRCELDTVLNGRSWAFPVDVRNSPVVAKMVARMLESGSIWKPRTERFYRPMKRVKP